MLTVSGFRVNIEEGIAGEGSDGGGLAGESVLGGLVEVVVDIVGADVGPPCLLPFPRSLRRLSHSPTSATRGIRGGKRYYEGRGSLGRRRHRF